MGICEGRVAVVTGAGRGIGRAHALELAREGAAVVVNDVGTTTDGSGRSTGPSEAVVREIEEGGGHAVASTDDVSDWEAAHRLVDTAISSFGRLDIVVNNAGILRDRMLVNMGPDEWDDVIRVHLRGTFAVSQAAASHWRQQAKEGATVDARIVNTTSNSGLFGNAGQSNYGAAKAGIAGFTIIAALELEPYGVTVNCVSPGALTRMTEGLGTFTHSPGQFDPGAPEHIASMVAWLASPQSRGISGRVFLVRGPVVTVAEGWQRGPSIGKDDRWSPAELGQHVPGLVQRARPNAGMVE